MKVKRSVAVAVLAGLAMGACSSTSTSTPKTTVAPATSTAVSTAAASSSTSAAESSSTTAAAPAVVDLASVCPNPIVVQTDWYPSPEHGYLYSMIGAGGKLDKDKGVYKGKLLGSNVDLEIRSGGPYLGYQGASSIMYQDPNILLAFDVTDSQVQQSAKLPTVAVMAPFAKNPQILMWNPAQYDFKSFDEIGKSDAKVLYFQGAVFMDYLVKIGAVRKEQLDSGYDGSPARFVADSKVVQQGFATSEPYNYESVITQFKKPVKYLVVADSGYNVYSQTLAARPESVKTKAECFKKLVPMVQKAEVTFYANPKPTNDVILDVVKQLNTSWVLDAGLMDYAAKTTIDKGFVANGTDGVVGSMDDARMTDITKTLTGLFASGGNMKADLKATELYTNEFLDKAISLPKK